MKSAIWYCIILTGLAFYVCVRIASVRDWIMLIFSPKRRRARRTIRALTGHKSRLRDIERRLDADIESLR